MRLLLDTPILLWAVVDSPKLSAKAREMIVGADEIFVSSATIWEVSIKATLGKLDVDVLNLVAECRANEFKELPVSIAHALQVRLLPDIHRDPFDRLLIAQALAEPLLLLTANQHIPKYTDLAISV